MTTLRQPPEPIGSAEVEHALARVLASEPFANAPALAAFLGFIVRETLAGREDRIKAYTIAVGALDRPPDFDPNDNPLVRVQARRLRAALDRYHLTEGRDAPLRIELPIGSYVPVFTRSEIEAPTPPPPAPAAAPTPRRRDSGRWLTIAAAVALIVVAALAIGRGAGLRIDTLLSRPTATTEDGPSVGRVLPLFVTEVDVRSPAPPGFDAELYRRRIEDFAQRFDDTVVVSRRAPTDPLPAGQPLYLLKLAILRDGSSSNAFYQLIHAADQRVLRSGSLRLGDTLPRVPPPDARLAPPLDEDLELVRDIVRVQGTIVRDLQRLADLGPELRCLTRAWDFDLDADPAVQAEARRCLQKVVAGAPRLVPALTLLAANHLADGPTTGDSMTRAAELLGRAARLAPASAAPLRWLSELLLLQGDTEAAAIAGRRALDANPDDLTAVAAYGALMARTGDDERAVFLLSRVVSESPSAPKWVQFYAFLALEALGRTREADERAAFFAGSASSLHLTAFALRAHRRGDAAAAAEAIATLRRFEPDFDTDRTAFLRRRGLTEPVARRLVKDLADAGLLAAPDR